ncbi:MAG: metallophosphoesterase [Bacteroidales bacterium]|nr:metallophosphoesterase [Bacteroidales bacterium]MBN2821418.1 metallophosphoesterase [Bacteroidales bacterium]
MHGGPGKFVFVILAVFFLLDIYVFRGLRAVTGNWNTTVKIIAGTLYWLVPVFMLFMTFFIMKNMGSISSGKVFYRTFYTFMGVMVLFYVPKIIFSVFELGNDLVNGFIFLINKFRVHSIELNFQTLRYVGLTLSVLLFFFTTYGILHGRYHYKTNQISLKYANLPGNFNNFKIVQISDWHIGSYYNRPKRIEEAVNRINLLKPDLILFTGDFVNNLASELEEFIPILTKLDAKYGKYSILGNHDYGHYVQWTNEYEKDKNLQKLKDLQKEAGFVLLNNDNTVIEINNEKITLLGVENWGLPPFPQFGNLKKALNSVDSSSFKILLSHDPSHWNAEVKGATNIDLTLSGHTHGMQFGVILKNFKWSPVKLKYPEWAGLYEYNNQKLYVNTGIGYIGFPGRVGVRPEIAVLNLLSDK